MINHFNIAHCRLDIGQERQFPITGSNVSEIIGIPYIGRRLYFSLTNRNNRMENLSVLTDWLISMEDTGDFKKLFLWCTLLAGDFDINVN